MYLRHYVLWINIYRGFIKGQALGKLSDSEDDFAKPNSARIYRGLFSNAI